MKIRVLTGVFLFLHMIVFAQEPLDTLPQLDLTKIALVNQGDSYITLSLIHISEPTRPY